MATESKLITILSIDGGGVRGLIPATVLDFLESYLKEQEKDNNVRIADYFDFIAGTSTGGLVTAMLTSPDPDDGSESNRAFTTDKIKKFYYEESPKIFPQKSQYLHDSALQDKTRSVLEPAVKELAELMEKNEKSVVGLQERSLSMPGWITWIINKAKSIFETIYFPKYHGEMLETAIKEKVGDRKLRETLTNVIIPSFDIKLLQPKVFSTIKATHDDLEDARLLDVCLSTSAAPYFLPLHKFKISSRKFNMVDGGVAANNPTLLALTEVAKEMSADGKSPCLSKMDSSKILVLSLGTGSSKRNNQLEGFQETGGGPLDWMLGKNGGIPIVDVLLTASDDMVDIYLAAFFQGSGFEKNYLRIQTDSLKDSEISMDNSSKDNLENLEKIGKNLLKKPVSAVNLASGLLEPIPGGGTNEDALKKFGDRLLAERKRRHGISSN